MAFNIQAAIDAAINQAVAEAIAALPPGTNCDAERAQIAQLQSQLAFKQADLDEAIAISLIQAQTIAERDARIVEMQAAIGSYEAEIVRLEDIIDMRTAMIDQLQASVLTLTAQRDALQVLLTECQEGQEPPPPPPPPPPVPTGFRDSTNTGHRNAPGYPGTLTPWNGVNQSTEYRFIDFGESRPSLPAGAKFFGCRFTSLWDTGWIIDPRNAIELRWCTFAPTGKTIPNPAWPSAGAGKNAAGDTAQIPYMLPFGSGYQFAVRKLTGSLLMEDCDIWGYGNAITLWGNAQKTIRRCWIHDAARGMASGELYHHDGIGHLDNGGCENVLIEDCTIASLGNTNGIAFQAGAYKNIIVRRNFISGWGFAVDMGHAGGNDSEMVFEDNILATDIQWVWGPIYTNFTTVFRTAGSSWKRNKLRVLAGTSPRAGSVFTFTQADDGKFILPDGAKSTTDFV